ncbi:beta-1,3-glucan-binding protein isoform X2 [Folsomia candida]|uniref:beta-1,3-glucan-binding protein isoform X2 n=1 Tax=Folsomia candida TaxID=158441 RepID=UPI001604D7AB|nr:beta-1,3-glucan-binding protein isoform X2 [Folsomia candida]
MIRSSSGSYRSSDRGQDLFNLGILGEMTATTRTPSPTITKRLLVISSLCVFFLGQETGGKDLSPTTTTVLRRHKPKELIFSDEFFDFDTSIWYHEHYPPGHKNGEFQSYSDNPENSYVRDGILFIKPTYNLDKFGGQEPSSRRNRSINVGPRPQNDFSPKEGGSFNPIVSARLNTRRAFAFQYGQLEVRAKVPEGDWIWPAVWLLPQQYRYGEWPVSGEIDLVECRGNRELFNGAGENIGVTQYGSTIHFGMDRATDMWRLANFPRYDDRGFNSRFHTFGMLWTPDEIAFTLDGEVTGVVTPPPGGFWEMGNFSGPSVWSENKMSPFDQPFNIVINVAVGGTFGYFPDNRGPKRKPWNNTSPTALMDFWDARDDWMSTWKGEDSALQVDYVRIWAL